MDSAEQILKAQLADLLWNNAFLAAEVNKLRKQLEDKNGPAPSEPATVE